MFTRKLALSVATAALLASAALPAKAAPVDPNDFRFYFETTLPVALGGTNIERYLTGYFKADPSTFTTTGGGTGSLVGPISNFVGTLGGTPVTTNSIGGAFVTRMPAGVAQLTSFNWNFSAGGNPISNQPLSMFLGSYTNTTDSIFASFTTINSNFSAAGSSQATVRPLLMPEINGGALPKGLFVIGGVFLMLFGRSKFNEA